MRRLGREIARASLTVAQLVQLGNDAGNNEKRKAMRMNFSRLRDSRRPSFLTSIRSHPAATHFAHALGTTYAASMASCHHQPVGGMFGVFIDRNFTSPTVRIIP